MKKYFIFSTLLFALLMAGKILQAQSRIPIHTKNSTLLFTTGKDGKLYQSYFGKRIAAETSLNQVSTQNIESYQVAGGENLFEPALRMIHADGNPSLLLKVKDFKENRVDNNNTMTSITLEDPVYPVSVVLNFSAYYNEDVIKAWVEIVQREKGNVTMTGFASSMLHFVSDSYWLSQFHGDWAEEVHLQESQLTSGIKIIDSKLGSRAHMYQTPAFLLALNAKATEDEGELIAGTLAWSGNFRFLFELDEKNQLRIVSSINPYASEYVLEPNKKFITPEFIFTYSDQGKGKASRSLHQWARNYGIKDGNGPRMTLLNNWEATQFDFNEAKLAGLFGEAKQLGVDMFLLDDGWFANKYPRNDDHAGLGDWQENKLKLPHGIGYLVKEAQKTGVKFGIWIEPEMVNPKSELYEKHPDWILKLPNREEHYFRNQLVLDIINPEVQDFVFGVLDKIMTDNPGVAFIKWDCNRMITNAYSPYLKNKQTHLYIEYVKSLYAILDRVQKKYPALPMMLCSGGGGRTDYGALKYFTEFWPSDNTDPVERVFIQWGYSYFFPAKSIACHITSWGKQSLKFRTDVAMMGRLGYDLNVAHMTANDLSFSQQAVANYKRLNPVILQGDMYRLINPYNNDRAVVMYTDQHKDNAVLFAYNLHPRYGTNWPTVKLKGLDVAKNYVVTEINLYPGTQSQLAEQGKSYTGEYLMNVGLALTNSTELTSAVIEIKAK